MPYFYLFCAALCSASASVLGGFYHKQSTKQASSALYTLLVVGGATLFWLVAFLLQPTACVEVLGYSLLFGGCFVLAHFSMIRALQLGQVGLTSLFAKLSLLGTTVWGFFFWETAFGAWTILGLGLSAVAIWLCLHSGKAKKEERTSFKWLVYALLCFVGNAGCAIVQKTQQMRFGGEYGNFFMLMAMLPALAILLLASLRGERAKERQCLQKAWYFPVVAGICNGLLNLFVLLLATSWLSPALIYPTIAVVGLAITTACSLFVFREKLRWWNWLGIVIGGAAIVLLSL